MVFAWGRVDTVALGSVALAMVLTACDSAGPAEVSPSPSAQARSTEVALFGDGGTTDDGAVEEFEPGSPECIAYMTSQELAAVVPGVWSDGYLFEDSSEPEVIECTWYTGVQPAQGGVWSVSMWQAPIAEYTFDKQRRLYVDAFGNTTDVEIPGAETAAYSTTDKGGDGGTCVVMMHVKQVLFSITVESREDPVDPQAVIAIAAYFAKN